MKFTFLNAKVLLKNKGCPLAAFNVKKTCFSSCFFTFLSAY